MSVVVCENLYKIYKSGEIEVVALQDLSLHVDKSEIRAIVGPSGSGKTTLINIIGGIDKPNAGRVIVDGMDITKFSEKELLNYRRRRVGIVFQFFNLIPTLTAFENVELPMVLAGVPREARKQRVRELLRLVGLEARADHRPDQLSGGEQQRVAIASALANDSPLILADEPTGELDTVTGRQIAELFRRLRDELGKTIIIVTHDVSIARISDRISRILDGRIIATITPAELELAEIAPTRTQETITKLEDRRQQILRELNRIEEEFRDKKIDAETFTKRFNELKSKLKAIEDELAKYTV